MAITEETLNKIKERNELVEEKSTQKYIKKAETLGRIPQDSEQGGELITYVKNDEGKIVQETSNVITEDVVVARNPEELEDNVYNEWLVPKETWLKNYGALPSTEFTPMKKIATITAMEMSQVRIDSLVEKGYVKDKGNGIYNVDVSWSEEGMDFQKGDYLTNQGYTINAEEMKKTYEKSNEAGNDKDITNPIGG